MKGNADLWDDVIEREGVGHVNDKIMLLLGKYVEYKLLFMSIIFHMKHKLKTSLTHTWPIHWHLIDYVLNISMNVRCHHHQNNVTTCWTDRILIRVKLAFQIAPKRRNQNDNRRRLDMGSSMLQI